MELPFSCRWSLNVSATNSGGNASYNLKANAVSINTNTSTSSYSTILSQENQIHLKLRKGYYYNKKVFGDCKSRNGCAAMPAGLVDGINYNTADAIKTVVLDAPLKDFVYVAGSFNNWQPTNSYAMKRSCFWKILVGIKWFGIV
jgi:hypothetical protein